MQLTVRPLITEMFFSGWQRNLYNTDCLISQISAAHLLNELLKQIRSVDLLRVVSSHPRLGLFIENRLNIDLRVA